MEWSIDKKPDVVDGEAGVRELTVRDLLVDVVNQLKIMNMHLSILTHEEIDEEDI